MDQNTKQTFSGYYIQKDGKPFNFNLYGHEDIDFKETSENLLSNMNVSHFKPLNKLFNKYGLKLHKFNFYSPKEYNYAGDNIDLVISISNKNKLLQYIKTNSEQLQNSLNSNKSYDGYMSLTPLKVESIKEKITKHNDIDIMVISEILKQYPLDIEEDFYNLFVFDNNEED